ncbi:MAG: metallophosphoesterase [Myxococcota bacterium]
MRIAHLSDLHLLALEGNGPHRFANKRLSGWVNLRYRRKAVHKPQLAEAVAREVKRRGVDHVVITGDVSNLALESEFTRVREFLDDALGLPASSVTMVPGNHDVYTGGAHRHRRFQRYFAEYITDDLPGAGGVVDDGSQFPFVRIRGPVALIGLSTAVPRPVLVASGELGARQRAALRAILDHRDVQSRLPVLLQHHPWHNPPRRTKRYLNGLADADAEAEAVRGVSAGLLLHGHLHRRVYRRLHTGGGGAIEAIGGPSASLLDPRDDRMGGFNVYDVDELGRGVPSLSRVASFKWHPERRDFVPAVLSPP